MPIRKYFSRIVLPLVLLVLVVGGIAWIAQNLPSWRQKDNASPTETKKREKPVIEFENPAPNGATVEADSVNFAIWKTDRVEKTQNSPLSFREFEQGATGYYDFPFQNTSDTEVEIGLETLGCDCSKVLVCSLTEYQWTTVKKIHEDKYGGMHEYPDQFTWVELSHNPIKKQTFHVKPKEKGMARFQWTVRKTPGQDMNLKARLWSKPEGGAMMRHDFYILGTIVVHPVRFFPAHMSVGVLPAGAVAKAEFNVWSSTRDLADLKLATATPDPLFTIDMRPLTDTERMKFEENLRSEKNKTMTKIMSAYHVTVTIHEQKDGQQLDQGPFLRRLAAFLSDRPNDSPGPEISGRVLGDIIVGGSDDHGKIRFKSFPGNEAITKEVYLSADPKIELEVYNHHPATLDVKLAREGKESGRWKLRVTIPADSFSGSFSDADAVILRIVGRQRLVRIPIEGSVSGR